MHHESRRFLRFRDPTRAPIQLLWRLQGVPQVLQALVADESHDSMGLVYVGAPVFAVGDELTWREAPDVHTRLRVVRATTPQDGVQFIAVKIRGVTLRKRR